MVTGAKQLPTVLEKVDSNDVNSSEASIATTSSGSSVDNSNDSGEWSDNENDEKKPDFIAIIRATANKFIDDKKLVEELDVIQLLAIFQQYHAHAIKNIGVDKTYFAKQIKALINFQEDAKSPNLSPLHIAQLFSPEGLIVQQSGLDFVTAAQCNSTADLQRLIQSKLHPKPAAAAASASAAPKPS